MRPLRIEVRPGNTLEGGGIVVWVYGRKAKIQLQYPAETAVSYAIDNAVAAWYVARGLVK